MELEQASVPNNRILPLRRTVDGWWVLTIHYSAVPNYDFDAVSNGMSSETIRQELEIDWASVEGKRVYPEFGISHHVALDPLVYNPKTPLYCGWDWGGTPAFVITQINAFGQWLIFPPVAPGEEASLGVYEFGQIVADHLTQYYASPNNIPLKKLRMVHYGDPQGAAPPPRTGDSPKELRSQFDIIRRGLDIPVGVDDTGNVRTVRRPGWGWNIRPGAVNITDRLEAVRARLKMTLRDGIPSVVVDPRAHSVKEGFGGGYCYKQRRDGHYEATPEKNWYSHQMDALGYVATRLFSHTPDNDEDGDLPGKGYEFISHAAGRDRW